MGTFHSNKVLIDAKGSRKPAIVQVVDPFLELLTVECGNDELVVSFRDVLPPAPEEPARVVKRRKTAASQPTPTPTPPPTATPPPPVSLPQFATIVRLDGTQISCGDLVSLSSNSADVVFIVLELFQEESDKS